MADAATAPLERVDGASTQACIPGGREGPWAAPDPTNADDPAPHWATLLRACDLPTSGPVRPGAPVAPSRTLAAALRVAAVMLWHRGYAGRPPSSLVLAQARAQEIAAGTAAGADTPARVGASPDEDAIDDADMLTHSADAVAAGMQAITPQVFTGDTGRVATAPEWRHVWTARATAAFVDGAPTAAGLLGHVASRALVRVVVPAPQSLLGGNISKASTVNLMRDAAYEGVQHLIIVVSSLRVFTYHCRGAVAAAQAEALEAGKGPCTVEVIDASALGGVLPMHSIVAHHAAVPPEREAATVRAWAHVQDTCLDPAAVDLPKMLHTDIMARWHGWPLGTLVSYVQRMGHGTLATWCLRRVVAQPTVAGSKAVKASPLSSRRWTVLSPTETAVEALPADDDESTT